MQKTFQGNPCKRGHSGVRYVSNKWCVNCAQQDYAADPERKKRQARSWAQANPERRKELQAQWESRNPERRRALALAWVYRNLDQVRRSVARWAAANPEKVRAKSAARRARRKAALSALTPDQRREIYALYKEAARRTKDTGTAWHVDHDKPLARGGKHHPDNLLVIPASINQAKGARFDSTLAFILS